MSKATETELSELHGKLCRGLTSALDGTVIETESGNKIAVPAPAAYFMAAITLLKNNNVTADAERNADLAELNKALAERRKAQKGSMTKATMDAAVDLLERDLGGMVQ